MNIGNLGFMEIMLILVVVLLLFGAKRLPEIGSSFGRSIREFKRGLSDVQGSIRDADSRADRLPPAEPSTVAREEEARPEPKRLLS
jgi:sec-independent protein translocase protein TatA